MSATVILTVVLFPVDSLPSYCNSGLTVTVNNNKTKDKRMKTEIKVWSRIGHTPVTGRSGAYSDELVSETTDCTNPHDAEQYVVGLMKRTPHAYTGYFVIHEWWNQNTCSQWVDISQTFEVSK